MGFKKNTSTTTPVALSRRSERGNVFFTLFGAVALVGVLGAGIMATMRGPLSTMVEVNRRAQAEAEMSIAARLALMEAVEAADDGDCDADGFVEALEFKTGVAIPVNGGILPDAVGSKKIDPWGVEYGYCVWDPGPTVDNAGCGGAGQQRLDGTGNTSETYPVLAVVSAGPDRTFQSTCAGGATPDVTKAAGSDDIINKFSYAEAVSSTGGLWNLKSGDPSIAEIDKDLEVAGGAKFTGNLDLSSTATAQLKLGAASMLLPTQAELPDTACDGGDVANAMLLRINTTTTPDTLQLCDGGDAWVSATAGSDKWLAGAENSEIYYNLDKVGIGNNNPAETLDVTGTFNVTGNSGIGGTLDVTGATTLDSTLDVTGAATLDSTLDVAGAGTFDTTLGVTGATTLSSTLRVDGNISDNDSSVTVDDDFDVTGVYKIDGATILNNNNTSGTILIGNSATKGGAVSDYLSIMDIIHGNKTTNRVGIGFGPSYDVAGLNDTLEVNGTADVSGTFNATGAATFGDNIEVTGDSTLEGVVKATDGEVNFDGDIDVSSEIFVNGTKFGPSAECDSDEKLDWDDSTGWSCIDDTAGGSGPGGEQTLEDVLTAGDDAEGLDALDFGRVTADEFCNVTETSCVDLASLTVSAIWEKSGTVIRIQSSVGYASNDFVFGSSSLADLAGTDDDARFFFDKSKGAFRAGIAQADQWDDAKVGEYTTVFGKNNYAADYNSFIGGGDSNFITQRGNIAWTSSGNNNAIIAGASNSMTPNASSVASNSAIIAGSSNTMPGNFSDSVILGGTLNDMSGRQSASIAGRNNDVTTGSHNVLLGGRDNVVSSTDSGVMVGSRNSTVSGSYATVLGGQYNTASGTYSNAMGYYATASGYTSLAMGTEILAGDGTGRSSFTTGQGGYSIAVGLQSAAQATDPRVTGDRSMVLFFDGGVANANSTYNFTSSDKFALIGGEFQIDDVSASANKGCIRYNSASSKLQFSHDCAIYADIGDLSGVVQIWEKSGALIRPVSGVVINSTDDFLFGADQITNQAGTADDARIFFDKSQGAFMAGSTSSTQWDAPGQYSIAFGQDTVSSALASTAIGSYVTASGNSSIAMGDYATASGYTSVAMGAYTTASSDSATAMGNYTNASGYYSVAMGDGTAASNTASVAMGGNTTASGSHSTAMGFYTNASGERSVAMGSLVIAGSGTAADGAGDSAFAVGFQTSNQSVPPKITGDRSMVLFFDGGVADANSTYNFTSNDKFAVIGGEFQIDDVSASANKGCIRYNSATTKLQFSHDCSSYSDIGATQGAPGSDKQVIFNDSGAFAGATNFVFESATGRVGIGTSSPSYLLSVNGITAANEFYPLDSSGTFVIKSPNVGQSNNRLQIKADNNNIVFRVKSDGGVTIGSNATINWDDNNHYITAALGTGMTIYDSNRIYLGGSNVGIGATSPGGSLHVNSSSASTIGSIIRGAAGQTANLTQWQNSSATVLSAVTAAGYFGIGDATPDSGTGGQLFLDVEGPIGGTKYCDEAGNNCFTAASVGSTGVFERSGALVRPVSGTVTISTDDFLFGALAITNQAGTADDARIFFDKSQGAFRAGTATGTQWDTPGQYSFATGYNTIASGGTSIAMGQETTASGNYSTAMGASTTASGAWSTAMGESTTAGFDHALATGYNTSASGAQSTAMGNSTVASGDASFAANQQTTAAGQGSTAMGIDTFANGMFSFAAGNTTTAGGDQSFAMGSNTTASGTNSVAMGSQTSASGSNSVAIGIGNIASGNFSFAGGQSSGADNNLASGQASFAFGYDNVAAGDYSFAIGQSANASGTVSFAMGASAVASADYSFAVGDGSNAAGVASVAMGASTFATGEHSTAMGASTQASGDRSAAMGNNTIASGVQSMALGDTTIASGYTALSLGREVLAGDGTGRTSFATGQGGLSIAVGLQSNTQATDPRVTGDRSMVLFFDGNTMNANSTYNFASNDKFALIGGEFVVDDVSSSANRGCIRYNSATTKLQFSHDCSSYTDLGASATAPGSDKQIIFNDSGAFAGATNFVFESSTGRVGIGTSSPSQILDIVGVSRFQTPNGGNFYIHEHGGGYAGLSFVGTNAADYAMTGAATETVFNVPNAGGIFRWRFGGSNIASMTNNRFDLRNVMLYSAGTEAQFGTTDSNLLHLRTNNQNRLTILSSGDIGIGDTTPDSGTGGQLKLDVEGPVGATQYCDASGNNCFTPSSVASTGVFERSGALVRPVSGAVTISTDDFVFGSLTLDDDGGTGSADDKRMFFDKSKGAFRVGSGADADGNWDTGFDRWDTANVGNYSFASGYYTKASGTASTAMGENTIASNSGSVAMGYETTASGYASTAMGYRTVASETTSTALGDSTTASGEASTAMGYGSTASGLRSTAMGEFTHAGSYGETSLGYYSLDTANDPTGIDTADTLFEIGNGANAGARSNAVTVLKNGKVGIGTAAPDSELHVVGDIRFTGVLIDVSDQRLKTDIKPLLDRGSMLERLEQINGYSFVMKDDKTGKIEYGVMAQEIERVFPELVQTADDEMGTKSVNYLGLIAPMIEATKELKAQNAALTVALAEKDKAMEQRLAALEADVAGVKLHTGYGFSKASMNLAMLVLMVLVVGGGGYWAGRRARKI